MEGRLAIENGVPVLSVSGELDLGSCDAFTAWIDRATESGYEKLIVDLTDVGYMESRAFGCLLTAYHRLGEGSLAVVSTAELRKLFAAARLDQVLCVVSSLDEAATCFASADHPS